jgi:hypothetical protein
VYFDQLHCDLISIQHAALAGTPTSSVPAKRRASRQNSRMPPVAGGFLVRERAIPKSARLNLTALPVKLAFDFASL